MHAPFTTDPAVLEKTAKPLRPDWGPFQPEGYIVGCGLAARVGYDEKSESAYTSLTRINDGAEWRIKPALPDLPPMTPVGLTCDEIFVELTPSRLIALRVDSLGAPSLPAPI